MYISNIGRNVLFSLYCGLLFGQGALVKVEFYYYCCSVEDYCDESRSML